MNSTPNESASDAGAAYIFTGFGPVPSTAPIITGYSGGPGGFTIHYDAGGSAVAIDRSTDFGLFMDIATGQTSGTYTDTAAPAGAAFYRVYVP